MQGLSWNTALSSSAVYAAEEVRGAVKVSRRSSRAKVAADAAAQKVQNEWDSANFSTDEEVRVAEAHISNAQSQAIHAAVVEHEASTAKRRATIALAHDTKCWNVHRKREILRISLETGKAQLDATQQSIAAWDLLHDGILHMSSFPTMTVQTRIDTITPVVESNIFSKPDLFEQMEEINEMDSFAVVSEKSVEVTSPVVADKSSESSSDDQRIYNSEHDMCIDQFATISKSECCEEKSITVKCIVNADVEPNSSCNFSNINMLGGIEDSVLRDEDAEFGESAKVSNQKDETLSHLGSLLNMAPSSLALSATLIVSNWYLSKRKKGMIKFHLLIRNNHYLKYL